MDDDQVRNILANLPEKLSRSRLEPYRKLIAALRRRCRPYREIAQILEEKCQLHVSPAAIHHFVRLHLRRDRNRQARHGPRATRNHVGLPAVIDQATARTRLKVQPHTKPTASHRFSNRLPPILRQHRNECWRVAFSGESKSAEKLIDQMQKESPQDTLLNFVWIPTIRAVLGIKAGNSD